MYVYSFGYGCISCWWAFSYESVIQLMTYVYLPLPMYPVSKVIQVVWYIWALVYLWLTGVFYCVQSLLEQRFTATCATLTKHDTLFFYHKIFIGRCWSIYSSLSTACSCFTTSQSPVVAFLRLPRRPLCILSLLFLSHHLLGSREAVLFAAVAVKVSFFFSFVLKISFLWGLMRLLEIHGPVSVFKVGSQVKIIDHHWKSWTDPYNRVSVGIFWARFAVSHFLLLAERSG